MNKPKVYIEHRHSNQAYERMFVEEGWAISNTIEGSDLVCLVGGADVSPFLYYEKNTQSHCSELTDIHTFGVMSIADRCNIPMVGICRGGQALNVYNFGSMKQHIEGHGRWHKIDVEGELIEVSSTHHQEMVPEEGTYPGNIIHAEDGTVEVIIQKDDYGHLVGISFQPHPEYHEKGHEGREFFFKLIKETMYLQGVEG